MILKRNRENEIKIWFSEINKIYKSLARSGKKEEIQINQ